MDLDLAQIIVLKFKTNLHLTPKENNLQNFSPKEQKSAQKKKHFEKKSYKCN